MLLVWAVMRSANEGETKSKIDSKDQVFEIKKNEQKKTCKTEKDDWNTCVKLRWESYTLDIALDHLSRTDVSEGMPLFIGRNFQCVSYRDCVVFISHLNGKDFCFVLLNPLWVSCDSVSPLAIRQIVQSNWTIWMQTVLLKHDEAHTVNFEIQQQYTKRTRWKWEFSKVTHKLTVTT